MTDRPGTLLEVRDLSVRFGAKEVVRGVNFDIGPGEKLALVGESGSGKTITALSLLRLAGDAVVRGSAVFQGRDLLVLSEREMRGLRGGDIAMIFQEPMTALNPLMTVGRQISEVLELKQALTHDQSWNAAIELLSSTGIPEPARRAAAFPHQLSGGQRQRAMIAMALASRPQLLLADEPTTALDVTIQAQILELIKQLKEDEGTSVILITHDLGVVAGMADEIMVMYAGRVAESAPAADLFRRPAHPYTRGLLDSVPRLDADHDELKPIRGLPPIVTKLPPGCPFAPRCDFASDACRRDYPAAKTIGGEHFTHCHHPLQEVSA